MVRQYPRAVIAGSLSQPGAKGDPGDPGDSAYDIAVANGFVGSEAAWLASLQGEAGQSAYEAAVANGFVGTEQEWLDSLHGTDGVSPAWLSGSGAPDGALGSVGDWYLDTAVGAGLGNVYEKTAVATWTLRTNILGPEGPSGGGTSVVPCTSPTGIAVAAKTTTIADYTLTAGDLLAVTFTNGTAVSNPTLAVNDGSAIVIHLGGTAVTDASMGVAAGGTVLLHYTGTVFSLVGMSTNYATVTQAEAEAGTVGVARWWTPERIKDAIEALAPVQPSALTNKSDVGHTHVASDISDLPPIVVAEQGTTNPASLAEGTILLEWVP